MKGIGYSRPPTPRYDFIWDIEQVLKHISSLLPNNKLSLKLLSMKLAMLLVLAATNRGSEIKSLDAKFLGKSKKQSCFFVESIYKNIRTRQTATRYNLLLLHRK